MRVWTRCTERLTQAVAMLVLLRLLMHLLIRMLVQLLLLLRIIRLWLRMLLVRRLVWPIRRDMLVDRLHVSLITHHTQMCTIARSNARCIREMILEFLRGLMYRCRPFRLWLLLA